MDANTLSSVLTAVITGFGLIYTGRQIQLARREHAENERWRRTEFSRSLIGHLSTDDELAFCARALDWGVGPLIIPQKHRALFPKDQAKFIHDWPTLQAAVGAGLHAGWDEPEALTYRYSFDAFFAYLESIQYYVRAERATPEQLVGLDYYLELLRKPIYAAGPAPGSASEVFRPFVARYYPNLVEFIWKPKQTDGAVTLQNDKP